MKIKKILEQVLTEEDNYDKLVKVFPELLDEDKEETINEDLWDKLTAAYPELLEEDVVTDDSQVDEKVLTEDANTFNSMKTALTAGKIDDLVYDSAYTEYIDEIYMNIVEELREKYEDLYIEPSIQAGNGGVFATFVSAGETYKNNWDYRTACERIEEFAIDAETEEEFKSLIKEYIVSKLNDARPEENDHEDSDDIEENLTDDLSDAKESIDEWPEYDDDYDFEDDIVEQDRMHAALYGGDREYCDKCGSKLVMDEWGGSCPRCDAEELFDKAHSVDESFDEDGNREYCDKCNTPLNDQGTCPKCDDGEEDYDDQM